MHGENADLARLLGAIAKGDETALRDLYEQTASKLLGIILRIIGDRSLAEDALQEVFVRVWQRAGSYDLMAGTPLIWLVAIARHRAIDAVRQERARRTAPQAEDWLVQLADPHDLEGGVAQRQALRRCLNDLDPTQRDCLVLAYCEGFSREELAARFERPVNTMKTWLRRGLLALRGCLEAA